MSLWVNSKSIIHQILGSKELKKQWVFIQTFILKSSFLCCPISCILKTKYLYFSFLCWSLTLKSNFKTFGPFTDLWYWRQNEIKTTKILTPLMVVSKQRFKTVVKKKYRTFFLFFMRFHILEVFECFLIFILLTTSPWLF